MGENIQVSIIIVNYYTKKLTLKCIESIYRFEKEVNFEIIIVDNESNEFNENDLRVNFSKIKLIHSPKNVGFAKGNNLGIEKANGEFILLLNSDTYFQKPVLKKCLTAIKSDTSIGAFGIRLAYPDGELQCSVDSFPSIFKEMLQLTFFAKWTRRKFREKFFPKIFPSIDKSGQVEMIWGTFFLFPKFILAKLPENKLYDDFFMYAEDLKWCWDIKKAGYQIFYSNKLEIVHIHGGSSKLNEKFFLLNKKNELLFVLKNYSFFRASIIFILKQLYTAVLGIKHGHFRKLFSIQNKVFKIELLK